MKISIFLKAIDIIRYVEYNEGYNSKGKGENHMRYMTANQASKKWNISQRRVQILCSQDRVDGVFKLGDVWAIPEDAPKPKDNRTKTLIKVM